MVNCQQARALIPAYVDGELDLARSVMLERHLSGCADCARAQHDLLALRSAIGAGELYHRAPAELAMRIRAALPNDPPAGRAPRRAWWADAGSLAGALVVLAVIAAAALLWRSGSIASPGSQLAAEVLASHIRSLQANHLTDVVSSDQHTVKPWFDGKLDFSPEVTDLKQQGFPLLGGRLDYLDNRPVAAVAYGRRRHVINLFIWPTSAADVAAQPISEQGYHLLHWNARGMTYWAVSDVGLDELQMFVQLIQQQTGAAEPS